MIVDINSTEKKYSIIYADPPWSYKNPPAKKGTSRGFAKNHYNLMSAEELKEIDIRRITEENAVLFMWATFPMIQEALETIREWGFFL